MKLWRFYANFYIMSRQILIGRRGNQPFAIQDPKVSQQHALLNVGDDGQLQLVDTGSTNGTYIHNGSTFVRIHPNQPYIVRADMMIQLGPETRFHVRRLLSSASVGSGAGFQGVNAGAPGGAAGGPGVNGGSKRPMSPKPPQPPKKKVDITPLRLISEQYEANKMEIDSKAGMINGLRSCTVLITMAAGTVSTLITSNKSDDSNAKIISGVICIGIALILMAVLLIVINNFNKSLMKRRKDNEHEYAVKYVCPECHVSFRGKIYENILAERSCPRCKAEYYERVLPR